MMKNKVIAALLLLVNTLLILYALQLAYLYNFSEMLFAFKLPAWLLALYIVVGSWGIFVDRRLYKSAINVKTALLQDLAPKLALFALEFWLF